VAGGPFACAEQIDTPPLLGFNPFAFTIVALGVSTRLNRVSFGFGGELLDGPDARLSLEAVRMQQGTRHDR
jgi:hypothetical protein